MTEAIWYFDFISPFVYLEFSRLCQLPPDLHVTIKPVLFSGLHFRHKGPAEIPSKRRSVYRFFRWLAVQRSVPFNMPPTKPFQPLSPLRPAIAAGATAEAVGTIFDFIYGRGQDVPTEPRKRTAKSAIALMLYARLPDGPCVTVIAAGR